MNLFTLFLVGVLQSSRPDSPLTIRCQLDTDLPLEEISVSVEEKREVKETPQTSGKENGTVILKDLPEGDLHLLFYREASLAGRIEVPSVKPGELIRLKVRLVEGNAILLDDYRIRGVGGFWSPRPGAEVGTAVPASQPNSPTPPAPPRTSPIPHAPSPDATPSPACPPVGEPVTLSGRVVRIIDNDSFELLSGRHSYVVYVGTATRLRGSRERIGSRELHPNQAVTVKGTVAAGPEGDCSIGAKELQPTP